MWWSRHKPIPEGWAIAPHQQLCHHYFYLILLIQVPHL